jgi:hypothetical protein
MSKFDTHDFVNIVTQKLADAGYRFYMVGVPERLQPPGVLLSPSYHFRWQGDAGVEEVSEFRDSELACLADAFDHYFALTIDFARAS